MSTNQGREISIAMVACFATLSNGEFFEALNVFKTYKSKLANWQKAQRKTLQKREAEIGVNRAILD